MLRTAVPRKDVQVIKQATRRSVLSCIVAAHRDESREHRVRLVMQDPTGACRGRTMTCHADTFAQHRWEHDTREHMLAKRSHRAPDPSRDEPYRVDGDAPHRDAKLQI